MAVVKKCVASPNCLNYGQKSPDSHYNVLTFKWLNGGGERERDMKQCNRLVKDDL